MVPFFRQRCLGCHMLQSCRLDPKSRQATSPPDNCLACHMPKRLLAMIAHTALTDHRILRQPAEVPDVAASPADASGPPDLIDESATAAPGARPADLRTLALAYSQVAENFSMYAERGMTLLEQAASEFPDDAEVETALGPALAERSSDESRRRAVAALEKAIGLQSRSAEARVRLAELKLRDGYANAAMELLQDAVRLEPYYAPAYLSLARTEFFLGDRKSAQGLLRRLSFDPGNQPARKMLAETCTSP